MKKILFLFVFALALTACEKSGYRIGDFAPQNIDIIVKNANGDNLLDPEFEGNVLENGVAAILWGQTYTLNENKWEPLPPPERPKTRAPWYGLNSTFLLGEYRMWFGGFNGNGNYYREEFVIDWGDGTSDTIWFDCNAFLNADGLIAEVHHRIWLKTDAHPDGELVNDNGLTVTIVK